MLKKRKSTVKRTTCKSSVRKKSGGWDTKGRGGYFIQRYKCDKCGREYEQMRGDKRPPLKCRNPFKPCSGSVKRVKD